mmetsp:Transcript_21165/g.46063  ORF Transcript_21165/g.46063 Transcript_21165/m.46063 type:complete len:449 (+) Transcript_21165:256-1602(+)
MDEARMPTRCRCSNAASCMRSMHKRPAALNAAGLFELADEPWCHCILIRHSRNQQHATSVAKLCVGSSLRLGYPSWGRGAIEIQHQRLLVGSLNNGPLTWHPNNSCVGLAQATMFCMVQSDRAQDSEVICTRPTSRAKAFALNRQNRCGFDSYVCSLVLLLERVGVAQKVLDFALDALCGGGSLLLAVLQQLGALGLGRLLDLVARLGRLLHNAIGDLSLLLRVGLLLVERLQVLVLDLGRLLDLLVLLLDRLVQLVDLAAQLELAYQVEYERLVEVLLRGGDLGLDGRLDDAQVVGRLLGLVELPLRGGHLSARLVAHRLGLALRHLQRLERARPGVLEHALAARLGRLERRRRLLVRRALQIVGLLAQIGCLLERLPARRRLFGRRLLLGDALRRRLLRRDLVRGRFLRGGLILGRLLRRGARRRRLRLSRLVHSRGRRGGRRLGR